MENKNIILIAAAIIILAIIGFFAAGMLSNDDTVTTPFETEFMEGSFVGNVTLVNDTEKFMHSYEDKEHNVVYNISTVDNSSALMDIYELQGLSNPDERTFNGNQWNIYFSQAVPATTNNTTKASNETMNVLIAESQKEKQGYLIYMIISNDSDINTTLNTFGEGYTDYLEPLLNSITLKESKNVPKLYEEFGLTKDQFNEQMDLIYQYKAGNLSALQGGTQ